MGGGGKNVKNGFLDRFVAAMGDRFMGVPESMVYGTAVARPWAGSVMRKPKKH